MPEPVDGWASETLLLHGIDGRWRVLPMDELGLDDAIWPGHDTYGAGSLSPDGRWWAGRSRAGVVLLDLGTGRGEIVGARRWVSEVQWRDDSRSLVVALGDRPRTELLDLSGRRSTLSFRSGEASAADDGRWWSGRATDDGRWESIEWLDGTQVSHGAVELPELRRSQSEQQLVGVEVAGGRGLLTLQRSPYRTLDLVVVGVSTPELLAHLHLNARNRRAFRDGEWLDPETVLLQWGPGLVAWRPLEGTFARVMDVDLPRDGFASLDVATDLAR
ncbi:hypothetical protein [Nocardioides lianchengensis]|uniref:hypothetical protein n=1 Tax=Nocardioides lianchengensis TaxID=1045774 RepID=UPI0011142C1C|nr:hypothetical protein [Nocardioides lianchengensis]NYG09409.1 hypothetical protein [Nocardioides lianchengensis]